MKGKALKTVFVLIICFIWINSSFSSHFSYEISNTVVKILSGMVTHAEKETAHSLMPAISLNVRKLAHFLEYTALGCAAMMLKLKSERKLTDVLFLGMGIAVVDETIQIFDGRTSMIKDVWIDLSGFLVGLLLVWVGNCVRYRRREINALQGRLFLIILVVLTLCFIWGNSLMPASISGVFSERIKELINLFLSGVGSRETLAGDRVLRKVAHASEFGLLGMELSFLFRNVLKERLTAVTFSGLAVAVIDETIQLFSAGRSSQLKDVWIDFAGFLLGVLMIWFVGRIKSRRGRKLCNGCN